MNQKGLLISTRRNRAVKRGYSLIEILIALAIIGTLVGGVMYLATTVMENAKKNKNNTNMLIVKTAIQDYYNENGEYPKNLNELPLKKPIPKDGWDKPFVYRVNDENAAHPFELTSKGSGTNISVWKK